MEFIEERYNISSQIQNRCDYNETENPELLGGKNLKYNISTIMTYFTINLYFSHLFYKEKEYFTDDVTKATAASLPFAEYALSLRPKKI